MNNVNIIKFHGEIFIKKFFNFENIPRRNFGVFLLMIWAWRDFPLIRSQEFCLLSYLKY